MSSGGDSNTETTAGGQARADASPDGPSVAVCLGGHPGTIPGWLQRLFVPGTRRLLVATADGVYLIRRGKRAPGGVLALPPASLPLQRKGWVRLEGEIWFGPRQHKRVLQFNESVQFMQGAGSWVTLPATGAAASYVFLVAAVMGALMGAGELIAWSADRSPAGLLLLVVAGMSFASAAGLAFPKLAAPWRERVALLAGVAVLIASTYLTVLSAWSWTRTPAWILWCCVIVLGVRPVLGDVADRLPEESMDAKPTARRGTVAGGALLISLGTLVWAVVQFWYVEHTGQPAGPLLQLVGELERLPAGDRVGHAAVRARIEIENSAKRRVTVVGSLYRASVVSARSQPQQGVINRAQAAIDGSEELPDVHRDLREDPPVSVQWGPVSPSPFYLEPGERFQTERVILVPRNLLGERTLRLDLYVAGAKGSRLHLQSASPWAALSQPRNLEGDAIAHAAVQSTRLDAPGLLHLTTYGRHRLVVVHWLHELDSVPARNVWPQLSFCVVAPTAAEIPCPDAVGADRWTRYYGLTLSSSVHELPLAAAP